MPTTRIEPVYTSSDSRLRFKGKAAGVLNIRADSEATAVLPSARKREESYVDAQYRKSMRCAKNDSEVVTAIRQDRTFRFKPLVRVTENVSPPRRFKIVQQFEGVITSVGEDALWADLEDITDKNRPLEVVEISHEEFSISDRELLEAGSVFYWTIGFETSPAGQVRRVSEMRVKRNPAWSARDLEKARAKGDELFNRFS